MTSLHISAVPPCTLNMTEQPITRSIPRIWCIMRSCFRSMHQQNIQTHRCYVSRECAEGFLSFHKKTTKRTATGIAIMVLAGVPYFLFESNPILSITFACMVLVIGLVFILSMAMMGNPYRKLKSERLLFDPMYYSELSSAREAQKKKSLVFIIIAICLILVAGISGCLLYTSPSPRDTR